MNDFKLAGGAFIDVDKIRDGIVAKAGGVIADVLVCGHEREAIGVLAWPSIEGCRELAGEQSLAALSVAEVVREQVASVIAAWNDDNRGASTRIARALLMGEPLPNETDASGRIDQRRAIANRAAEVADLFADPPAAGVIVARRA